MRLRSVLVRPGRNRLAGPVEVDETYIGGEESGLRGGRARGKKVLTGIAVEVREPRGLGRGRMRAAPVALRAPSAAADSSTCFLISTLLLRELSRNQVSKKTLGRRKGGMAAETIAERFERDRDALLPLPPVPYDACDTRTTRVTSLSLVRYRRNDYSVPTAYDACSMGFRSGLYFGRNHRWAPTSSIARRTAGLL